MAPSGPKAAAKPAAAKADAKAKAKPKVEKKPEEPRPEDLIEKVNMPNKEEFEAKFAAIQDDIDKLQKQQKDLATRISERSGGKDEYQTKRAELRAELDHWSGLIDQAKGQKDEISKAIGDKKAEGMEQRGELNKMKKNLGYTNETEIDDRIRQIEYQMSTSSMPLKEEKKLMAEISQLKKDRPKVAGIKKLEGSLGSDDRGQGMKDQRKAIGEQMGQLIEEKKKVSARLTELNEQRKAETGDLPALIEEREKLSQQIRDLSGKRNEVRAERREQEQAYYAYQTELRKIRQERSVKEREARQNEYEGTRRQREAEKLDDQPHVGEITLIEQTIAFCKTLTKEKDTTVKEETKEIEHKDLAGVEVLVSKKNRDEDMFVPTKAKSKKSKGAKAAAGEGGKPIKHSAETFQLFSKLKLDAPITTADIPELLEKLEAQLADYKDKVKTWEAKREELKKRILDGGAIEEEKEKEEEKEEEKAEE